MQYADIALPVKTATRQESFTYRIPPRLLADISVGQRVIVPFYRRQLLGTVVSLRAVPPTIKGSFKEIKDLAEPFPLFTRQSLELAKLVAARYAATLGDILESAAPKPARRLAKKIVFAAPKTSPTRRVGKVYGLYLSRIERYPHYLTLIRKALANSGNALVLFPSQILVHEFTQYLMKAGVSALALPPSSDLTGHYQAWIDGLIGQPPVIVGTRKAIFLPQPRLRLVIVDGPSEFGYKEEQFPYYHAVTVAKLKAELAGSHLVLGDSAPQLSEWLDEKAGRLHYIRASSQKAAITLVDTTTDRGLITQGLIERINETLKAHGRVALFFNRKGSGRFYRCLECETAIYCPRCDSLMTVYQVNQQTSLRCGQCGHQTNPPYRCPVCQSYKLGCVGLGVRSVADRLAEHFPETRIVTLDEKHGYDPTAEITVATAQLLFLPTTARYDLVAAFHIDQLLHGSDWNTNEVAYLTLSHLAERTDQLLIHTSVTDHPVIQAFCQQDINALYTTEAAERTAHHYPPVQPIIKLTLVGNDRAIVQTQAAELYRKYQQLLPPTTQILPPNPARQGKQRGKYRYQIIIKSTLTRLIMDNLPTNWLIDPEPTEL